MIGDDRSKLNLLFLTKLIWLMDIWVEGLEEGKGKRGELVESEKESMLLNSIGENTEER